jgi:hypothetical protein
MRSTIISLRPHAEENRATRGATPQLTVVKHQLRDWVESRLAQFPEQGDPGSLSEMLKEELRPTDLFCENFAVQCWPSTLGFIDDVQVRRERGFLVIQTAVGISCGYDESVYLYSWNGAKWQRIWVHEQNTYTEKEYLPQTIHSFRISQPDKDGDRLVLSLGSRPSCSGAFKPVFYRVWRMNASNEIAPLLLDRSEMVADGYPPIKGQVTADNVFIEFTAGGTGYGESHKAARHFEIRDGRLIQVNPIATIPRDFVEEWLSAQWSQSAALSESAALGEWHAKLHREDGMGDYPDPALRCSEPDLWQIGTRLHDSPKTYYLIRWRQPFDFMMAGVSDTPYPNCTIPDPSGDKHPEIIKDLD